MIKNFLIVGFGGMGCRHAQSLINAYKNSVVMIYEPNDIVFKQNLVLIGQSSNKNIQRLNKLTDIKSKIDFCVIATSSEPRFKILKKLLRLEISNFLVEKVVFQSNYQFQEINKLVGNKKVYVNFVNRYFKNYIEIKKDINNNSFTMDVVGGDFGLGCNALHYFDLFKYFGSKELELSSFNLQENINGNRRGVIYKEVEGQISVFSKNGSSLNISSNTKRSGDVEIFIKYSNKTHIINEGLLEHIKFFNKGITTEPLVVKYTSLLTAEIYKDILKNKCLLPVVSDCQEIHSILFKSVNKALKLNPEDKCPIT